MSKRVFRSIIFISIIASAVASCLLLYAMVSAAAEDAYEVKLIPRRDAAAGTEITASPPAAKKTRAKNARKTIAGPTKNDRTEEIWLRLASRFKTSEIELARQKIRGASLDMTSEIVVKASHADLTDGGDTHEAGLESTGTGEVSAARVGGGASEKKAGRRSVENSVGNAGTVPGQKLPPAAGDKTQLPATEEVKIEPGVNLFYRHCYSCHFDHEHFKMANNLSGREFWLKYADEEDIKKTVRRGVRTPGGDMPAYGAERLGDGEVDAIIEHLQSMTQPLKISSGADEKPRGAGSRAAQIRPAATQGTQEASIIGAAAGTIEAQLNADKNVGTNAGTNTNKKTAGPPVESLRPEAK